MYRNKLSTTAVGAEFVSCVPPTPAEAAAAAARWERRGILGRLVRLDGPVFPLDQTQPVRLKRRARTAEAAADTL
jgi:hypothetical protein